MAAAKSVGVKADATLSSLEAIVQQQEDLLGPLVGIGHGTLMSTPGGVPQTDHDLTVLAFDMDQDPPAAKAILRAVADGQVPVLPGFTLLCTGQGFVAGVLSTIGAYRPHSPIAAI